MRRTSMYSVREFPCQVRLMLPASEQSGAARAAKRKADKKMSFFIPASTTQNGFILRFSARFPQNFYFFFGFAMIEASSGFFSRFFTRPRALPLFT